MPASSSLSPDGRTHRTDAHRADPPTSHGLVWSFLTTTRSHQVVLEGERGCSGSRGEPELREDVLDVASHRVLADHECRRDLAVALPGCDEPQHLELARRKTVLAGRRGVEPRQIRLCTEALEKSACRVELQCRGALVAERTAR